ncbi:MAG: carbamate kinase [marine bacterium B5-7]|nr:MAG: carbamate kinase [marine bacterium B5-7]
MSSIVVALGGNALASSDDPSGYTAAHQIAQITRTSEVLADVIADGHSLVIIHGNGPQVGNLLVKNDLARDVVPAVPLYWCVAQTQATIGIELTSALKRHLAARGITVPVVPTLTRVRVDAGDIAFSHPTKPIGLIIDSDNPPDIPLPATHAWRSAGPASWRRVVPSPQPLEIVDTDAISMIIEAGGIAIACGGGGIPVVMHDDKLIGADAVIDKDKTAVMLAAFVRASRLVILTDVDGVAIDFGTERQRFLGTVTVSELEHYLKAGQFGSGSMDAKVCAAIDFVRLTGEPATIGNLADVRKVIEGHAGTCVVADET